MRRNDCVQNIIFFMSFHILLINSAVASEIWVSPNNIHEEELIGDWSVSTANSANFKFALPRGLTTIIGAKLVLIGSASSDIIYDLSMSVAKNGFLHDEFTNAISGLSVTLVKGQLTELDIESSFLSAFFQPAYIGTGEYYIAMTFSAYQSGAAKVVGLRFQYEVTEEFQGPVDSKWSSGASYFLMNGSDINYFPGSVCIGTEDQIEGDTTGLYQGSTTLIRTFRPTGSAGYNVFAGGAGNSTMSPRGGPAELASYNVGIGHRALTENSTGFENTALGYKALNCNISGQGNVAVGSQALCSNTTGRHNTAIGTTSLPNNTTGTYNVGLGTDSLFYNTTGSYNMGIGYDSLHLNTKGSGNTAIGFLSLYSNVSGSENVAIGFGAGTSISDTPNMFGNQNTWIGYQSGPGTDTQLTNTIAIGYQAQNTASNQVVLGNAKIMNTILHGNIGAGTTDQFGGGEGLLSLGNATVDPKSTVTGAALFFAKDDEMWVMDGSSNKTQISPHSFDQFQPDSSEPLPWSYTSENSYIGKKINVDLAGAIRAIEQITGKKFIYYLDIPKTNIAFAELEKKEAWKKSYQEKNSREIEVTKAEAIMDVPIDEDDLKQIETEITFFELDSLSMEVTEKKVPKYKKYRRITKQLKKNVRFDNKTGKFFRKISPSEQEVDIAANLHNTEWQFPKWIRDRACQQ